MTGSGRARPAFNDRLLDGIRRSGLNQRAFAQRVGVTEGAVSKWVNEEREPDLRTLARIAVILGVTVDWLVGVPDAEEPPPLPRRIDARAVRRLIKKGREFADAVEALAKELPDDES